MSVVGWTPEKLRSWSYERLAGMQQRSDWLFYPKHNPDPRFATFHWLWVLGHRLGRHNSTARSSIKCEDLYRKSEEDYYVIKGCNLHDKAEWVQYVRTDGDYRAKAASS